MSMKKGSIRNFSFYVSSNSFASFLLQTSKQLCTAVSTSPPGHPGLQAMTCICIGDLLPIELVILFILVLRK